jgi:hypothetical protein
MQQLLSWAAQSQGLWSATAGALKKTYEGARRCTFASSILGALAVAVASQQDDEAARRILAIAGATMLALGGFLSARFLAPDKAVRWVRARGASEALKRAAYSFAAQAAPYDDPATHEAVLRAEVQKIESDVDDLLDSQAPAQPGSTPDAALGAADYRATRVEKAAGWYEASARKHQRAAKRLRTVELLLALFTTLLTAVVGAVSKDWLQRATGFDWAALIAVLTTISGVVLAHIEAARYDYLITSYRAAARRLRSELAGAPAAQVVPLADWSAFVVRCEDIIANETGSWAARFSKPTTP